MPAGRAAAAAAGAASAAWVVSSQQPGEEDAEEEGSADGGWDELRGCGEVVDAGDVVPCDDELDGEGQDRRDDQVECAL